MNIFWAVTSSRTIIQGNRNAQDSQAKNVWVPQQLDLQWLFVPVFSVIAMLGFQTEIVLQETAFVITIWSGKF